MGFQRDCTFSKIVLVVFELKSPNGSQAVFALDCATLMPWIFKETALFLRLCWWYSNLRAPDRTKQAPVHTPPILESTFDPGTRGGRIQA
ncbi:hypothetical protein PoB_003541900 [Plakobranchus ocellatus]|uniref:Uncharacterized protein n=1 Tax=Plakobranchus ocellatus TaxID=259542 RepID=A0AAV4AMC2_9GAST|nr:hypothetical protein PoB_003541900 [Plakobranchus ocellatus]